MPVGLSLLFYPIVRSQSTTTHVSPVSLKTEGIILTTLTMPHIQTHTHIIHTYTHNTRHIHTRAHMHIYLLNNHNLSLF